MSWTSAPETPAEAPGESQEIAELRAVLARPPATRSTGLFAVILLGIFVVAGLNDGTWQSMLVLVAVLLVHEGGHALGMKAFGYRDVKVFFLPFFGAATTGRKDDALAWQRAVVLLLGPLPGIVLGMALLAVSRGAGILGEVGRMAIYVNAFNLLPFEPLDGGRVLGVTVFSRSRWLEGGFAVLGGLVLLWFAWRFEAWIMAVPGALVIMAVPRQLRLSGAARRLSVRGIEAGPAAEQLPPHHLAALDDEVRAFSPGRVLDVGTRAGLVRDLHTRMRLAPPALPTTLALLAAYGGGVVLSLAAIVVVVAMGPRRAGDAPQPATEAPAAR